MTPWRWVPTLYFSEGLPYVVVMTVAVVLYKNLGISNTAIALYTSWLYLPWVIKPLWSPVVDLLGTKRRWIVVMQFVLGAALAMVALGPAHLALPAAHPRCLLVDGLRVCHPRHRGRWVLPPRAAAAHPGGLRRSAQHAYRLAMIAGQGGVVYLAGLLQDRTGQVITAWVAVFSLVAAVFGAAGLYHWWALPRPPTDLPVPRSRAFGADFAEVFAAFFRKPGIGRILAFLLLYRFAEAQLLKLVTPFLLDPRTVGGLGLRTQDVGIAYGTIGVAALVAGGLLGGWVISRIGLRTASGHSCSACIYPTWSS